MSLNVKTIPFLCTNFFSFHFYICSSSSQKIGGKIIAILFPMNSVNLGIYFIIFKIFSLRIEER